MKRILPVVAACLLAALCAWAAGPYKLVLRDGSVLVLDRAPTVRGGVATILRAGVEYTLPAERIDEEASREANPPPARDAGASPAPGPKRYTDDDLEKLRATAPLANESPAGTASARPTPETRKAPGDDPRLDALYAREERLKKERATWVERQTELQQQLDALAREQADQDYKNSRQQAASARGEEHARWRKAQEAKRARLQKEVAAAQEKVRRLDDALKAVGRDIVSRYEEKP